ncbi:MAG: PilZ domain-containing protein [Leptospiraceae bacterium]|nr:PilZ domain-containing protein [Leptospiraceae bacterium]
MAQIKTVFNNSMGTPGGIKQKRKKARVRLNHPGKYYLSGKGNAYDCMLIDVGLGGLTIQCGTLLYQNEVIIVEFSLGNQPLRIRGAVGRVNGKNAVIRYDELPEKDTEIIQDYIHNAFYAEKKK